MMMFEPISTPNILVKGTVLNIRQSIHFKDKILEYITLWCTSEEFEIPIEYTFRYSSKWKSLNLQEGDAVKFLVTLKRYSHFVHKDYRTNDTWNVIPPELREVVEEIELQRPKQIVKVEPEEKESEVVYKERLTYLLLILLEVAGNDAKYSNDFEEAYRKRLRFQKQTDWKRYRASVDLIEDTEQAILSAFRYQLGDLNNNNKDYGETYLRLYGILNAVYLQMNAFKEIANLLNYPERNMVMRKFEALRIYKLRNIAGAHTTDYQYSKQEILDLKSSRKTTSFRIIQAYLDKTGKDIQVLDENNVRLEFNLLSLLKEYESLATELLIKLILHIKETLLITKEDKAWMQEQLDELLPNLIDYSKLDMNKTYKSALMNKIKEEL